MSSTFHLVNLHGSVDGYHFVVVVWIEEYVVNVVLPSSSGHHRGATIAIHSIVPGKYICLQGTFRNDVTKRRQALQEVFSIKN